MEEELNLRVLLKDKHLVLFKKIKNEGKFMTNAETLRYCIMETANSGDFHIEEDLRRQIEQIITKPFIKNNYYIYNVNDFIKKAIEHYLKFLKDNFRSIKDWDVRTELPEDDLKIALALLECQNDVPTSEVTSKMVAKKLERRDIENIRKTLDKFVTQGQLSVRISNNGEKYYHAK